jgi:hypothetical protein
MKVDLAKWKIMEYISAAIRGEGGSHMCAGSLNAMVTGLGFVRAFKGVTALAGKVGSRVFFSTDQSYAGLGTATTTGTGSVFNARNLLCYIGAGQVYFAGLALAGIIASSTLSFVKKSGGVYAAGATTGPFQAGHAQPSAPTIIAKSAPSAGQTEMTGVVTVVIWRVSSYTGQVSLKSLPSNVLTLTNQSVIVQMPLADSNGQTHWGIGVVRVGFPDLGNHYELPTSLGGEVAESALTTIDGYTRAVEISWTNGALIGQSLAPDKAFPPPAGQFAGVMNDTLWLESDGIIYVGEPGQIGSFPPSNSLFPNEPAVHYLRWGDGLTLRFGKNSMGALSYVGGSPALEYQAIWENLGISLPQNVALGANGRLLIWLDKPAVVENGVDPDYEYATKVLPDFAGWDAQTSSAPVCVGYDPKGQYEVWCYQKKVMAKFVPRDAWCAPIDLTGKVSGNIVSAFTNERQLYLCTSDGAALTIYKFDVGSGSVMVVQTDDQRGNGYGATISEVQVQVRADNTANPVKVEVIKNFNDASPIQVFNSNPAQTGPVELPITGKNIINVNHHAMRVTMTSTGGDAGVDLIATRGAANEVVTV